MTAYTDFTSDFPKRCLEVLNTASADAAERGREITLLYMAASASLLVPFERLKPDTKNSAHPFRDNRRDVVTANRLEELLRKNFVGSVLCPSNHSFQLAKNVKSVSGDLDDWLPNAGLAPIKDEKTDATIKLVRNALAHGNIYTTGDPIQELVFVTEIREKERVLKGSPVEFDVLQVSHGDFKKFVCAWIEFLQKPDTDAGITP